MTQKLFEAVDFTNALASLTEGTVLTRRNLVSKLIRDTLKIIHAEAEKQLVIGRHGTACAENISYAEDQMIEMLFNWISRSVFHATDESIAVIAVGGYGRGTLAPGSDIDLLFLVPGAEQEQHRNVIEFLLYALWDARQKVGHATRNIADCLKLAKTDNTILTAMLESRFICGNHHLFVELTKNFRNDIVKPKAKSFVADKLAERDQRHSKSGASRYMVEPDLKDGKGGLRDLHTLFWIAKFLFDTQSVNELATKGAFTTEELKRFQKAEDFLWTVRCHLHFLSGRPEEKLSFERQGELAGRLGYKSRDGLREVERFMKHYFLVAKEVGDLTRIFCASLEDKHLKDAPSLAKRLSNLVGRSAPKISGDFSIENGRIDVKSVDIFRTDPINIIRIFKLSSDRGVEIHPDALVLMRQSLRLIDDNLRNNEEANTLFVEMLTTSGDAETMMRMMNEAGVLGRFIPEFGKIVAMMQFNMYHHYTVDEHSIRAVGILQALEKGELSGDHPLSAQLLPTLMSRKALYVATLIHDIGKGRNEDHSVVGERISRELCPRLGLSASETETVAWLVRHHLLMSETAQMRDLNDFKTILDFTAIVQSPERLKLLLILTVADIRAVGPGVWNGWKGQLLRTLYAEAEPVLNGGHTAIGRKERAAFAQDRLLENLPLLNEGEGKTIRARHYDAYWLTVATERQLRHHALIARSKPGDIVTDIKIDKFSGITEITIYAADHPRLLAMLFGACTAAQGNIMGAQIFTTTEGMALDTVLLQREFPEDRDEQRKAERTCDMILRVLRGEVRLAEAIAQAQRPQLRIKAFTVEPRVIIDNGSSNKHTVVEINGLDRTGLLHGLTEALFHLNLNITSAHITTFGEKAVDVFYVTDLTGAKITSDTRAKRIETELMAVLQPQAPEGKI